MTNTTLTADIIAKEAVMILDNELVMAKQVFRGYENEFEKKINGYEVGETISIRVPNDFTVTDGPIMDVQDVRERKIPLTVNRRKHVAFEFTSQDLTLNIGELSERVIKPAMVQLANKIDTDLHGLYADVPNWVGTPGQVVDSYNDFAKAPERMDEFAVPQDQRYSVLSPQDHWALAGSQTSLFNNSINQGAYRKGSIGDIAGVDTFKTQNVATHVVGDVAGSPEIDQSINPHTLAYTSVMASYQQTLTVDGFTSASPAPAVGDVFEIEDVYAVNGVTKERLHFRRQFVVKAIANNTGNQVDITFSPPILTSGAFQTCSVAANITDLDGKDVTFIGTTGQRSRQNMAFHKNAFALVSVPLVRPPGATDVGRQTYKGTSVRVIPVWDGISDKSAWRLDVLYGMATIDPRLAVRLSGTSSP